MKRGIALLLAGALVLSLAACAKTETQTETTRPENEDEWGLTLTIEQESAKGGTLVFTQTGGDPEETPMETGTYYTLMEQTEQGWEEMDVQVEGEYGWTAEALVLSQNAVTRIDVRWEYLYDALPAGTYRIGKEVYNPAVDEEKVYYAEFTIGDGQA